MKNNFLLLRLCFLTISLSLLIGLSNETFGQDMHLVSLQNEPIIIPNRTFYIDSVIDDRPYQENIGVVQKGMANRQVDANFTDGFQQCLTKYFKAALPKGNSSQRRFIAVFEELTISEKTYRMKERGFAEVKLTFCEVDSGKLKKIFYAEDIQESGGMDVTKSHPERVTAAIQNCVKKLAVSDFDKLSPVKFDLGGVSWNPNDSAQSILAAKKLQIGIYKNLSELRENRPSIHTAFKVTPKNDLFELRDLVKGEKILEPYGFCDGKDIYINTFFYNQSNKTARYGKVVERGRLMAWVDHYVGLGERAAVQAGFGLIGYAVAKSGLDCILLDIKTGIIAPIKDKKFKKIFMSDPEVFNQFNDGSRLDVAEQLNLVKQFNSRHKDF